MTTSLEFIGDLSPWWGVPLALLAAAVVFVLYRRETRDRGDWLRWLLPSLRALAVFLIVLALTGPILHHEKVIRELGRLFVFVDGSESMAMGDEEMPEDRKAAAMQAAGFIPRSRAFEQAEEASAHLARAQLVATRAIGAGPAVEPGELAAAVAQFGEHLESAFDALEDFQGRAVKFGQPGRGFLLCQTFTGDAAGALFDRGRRAGETVGDPAETTYLQAFEFPRESRGGYSVWMRGFLHAPADGEYRFYLASDDQGELWMSPDDRPGAAARLCNVTGYTGFREWSDQRNQESNPVRLERGRRYYIEAVLVAGGTVDHLSVGWRRPGSDEVELIGGEHLSPAPVGSSADARDELAALRGELLERAGSLAGDRGDPFQKLEALRELNDEAIGLQERLAESVRASALAYVDRNRHKPEMREAIERFDGASRLERARRLLLDPDTGILRRIAKQQDIELVALTNRDVETMWWQRRGGKKTSGDLPREFAIGEQGYLTDLGQAIGATLEGEQEGVGVILLTDGQHNGDGSPVETSKVFGERGIPVFAVGYGNEAPPRDMALTDIAAPATVFAKDKVAGTIELRDSMRPGVPYRVVIEHDGEVVWEEAIESNNAILRSVPFEFPIEGLVDKVAAGRPGGVETRAVALGFEARVEPVGAPVDESGRPLERITENNRKELFVQAVAHAKKVLVLDSRPRWETRYIAAMFERDEQWDANVLMEVFPPDQPQKSWERGDEPGMFPASREELFTYDVIFFGDLPRRLFRDDELQWIAEFVGDRAGGLIVVDGQRGSLTEFDDSPLADLLPVARGTDEAPRTEESMPAALELTSAGGALDELRFASSSAENREIWSRLRAPAWVAPAQALPGSQVLAAAELRDGRELPVLVTRRYGAGAVLYCGSDELWRWRYNVGDRYHQKFWVQMTNWTAEQPFSVQGRHVSIAADKMVYESGARATLRVRIRDDDGKAVTRGDFVAQLFRNGELYSEVELEADPNLGGIFRARTGSLEGGEFEVAVKQKYLLKRDREFDARAEFVVRGGLNRELDDLSVDRELLEAVALNSGGQYFPEEQARNLVDLLESIDKKKVIAKDTNLWSSYWWFCAIVGLLVAEWALRKRAGYL